jgi:hypothetical protein
MDSFPFYINILINSAKFIKAFINNDCLCYAVFNEFMVRALKLSRISIFYKSLKLAEKDIKERKIFFITYANVDIDKYKEKIFGVGSSPNCGTAPNVRALGTRSSRGIVAPRYTSCRLASM